MPNTKQMERLARDQALKRAESAILRRTRRRPPNGGTACCRTLAPAHVLTAVTVLDPSTVHVVDPAALPDPNWLEPGIPGAGKQTTAINF
jgi:hypothetical protein